MTDDKNSLAKRAGRYARVSTKMGGLAARLAGEKFLGLAINRDDHARALKDTLGNLRGPLMKIAQLLATIPDALPAEYAAELQHLQANAPPMGWNFVRRRMRAELGEGWESKFAKFPHEATAAASLGQVHKALPAMSISKTRSSNATHDSANEYVACKLQYPDMESAVDADVAQLKMILSLYRAYDKAVQTDDIIHEVTERLGEELDYRREAKQCALYGEIFKDDPTVRIPRVVDALCGPRLLTTTWLEGKPILDFREAPLETRNRIAINLFRAWYVPLYQYGIIHGDPHPGNYTLRDDLGINLLDFGCIRVFPPRFVQGILTLYHALQNDDDALAVKAYEAWGFKNLSKKLIATLNLWARFLYGPVLEDKTRLIGQRTGKIYGAETAKQVHEELRQAGGVSVPREFVFMDRAALGLGSVFIHLQAEVNWFRLFGELTIDFDVKALEKRQKTLLKRHGLMG